MPAQVLSGFRSALRARGSAAFLQRLVFLAAATLGCGTGSDRDEDTARDVPATTVATAPACLVDSTGIGGARLGATLDDARRALPRARLERTEDGDGAQLVAVMVDTVRLMILNALEDDTTLDWSKPIHSIETFHPTCRTASGVHPGALVTDVAATLGSVVAIVESEIESRQYVTFARQPAWMTLRLDYSGIFPEGQRQTTEHRPDARIFSIAVSR